MNKDQLKRLVLLLSILAAIIFIPYYIGRTAQYFGIKTSVSSQTFLTWLLGCVLSIVFFIWGLVLAAIITPFIIYIKTGKFPKIFDTL